MRLRSWHIALAGTIPTIVIALHLIQATEECEGGCDMNAFGSFVSFLLLLSVAISLIPIALLTKDTTKKRGATLSIAIGSIPLIAIFIGFLYSASLELIFLIIFISPGIFFFSSQVPSIFGKNPNTYQLSCEP